MRCSKARDKLALYVGGDLPEPDVVELKAHIDDCPECAHELDQLHRAKAVMERMGRADAPDPLPEGMAGEISRIAINGKASVFDKSAFKLSWRPVFIFGGIAAVLLVVIGLTGIMREDRIQTIMEWQKEWLRSAGENRSIVQWEAMRSLAGIFGQPIKLGEWTPPGEAGVYAIMHRADSEEGVVKYTVDYCGQSRKLGSYRAYPWLQQVKKRLLSQTGSIDNIYIAVILMPESTGDERRAVEEVIIEAFNPYFNRQKGA